MENNKNIINKKFILTTITLVLLLLINVNLTNATFLITEVSPKPENSSLEYVELYLLDYQGEDITIRDNIATSSINNTRLLRNNSLEDYESTLYSGYALITQYPEHFTEQLSGNAEVSCLIIGLSGKIGNGLADAGDQVNVTINNITKRFSYTNAVRGQSYNNECNDVKCLELENTFNLTNESPCIGNFIFDNINETETNSGTDEGQNETDENETVEEEVKTDEQENDTIDEENDVSEDEITNDDQEIIDEEESSEDEISGEEQNEGKEETNTDNEESNENEVEEEETNEEDITEEEQNEEEQNEEETENVCEEIVIESQSHPYMNKLEYKIISKGLEYEYWIEYYNGSIAKKPATSKTNALKTYTPKKGKSEQEIIFIVKVKYVTSCTGEETLLEKYVMFVHPFKDEPIEQEKVEEVECVPNDTTSSTPVVIKQTEKTNLLKSFFTRAQKKGESYNYFYSASNMSGNISLYACSIIPVTETENKKHIFDHKTISQGLPLLVALDDKNNVLEAIVGTKPEFISDNLTDVFEEIEEQVEEATSESEELTNAITAAATRTVSQPTKQQDSSQKKFSLTPFFEKSKPYIVPAALIFGVGIAVFRKIK